MAVVSPLGATMGPSRNLDSYVLFAGSRIRARRLRITSGDVGVNRGSLRIHDAITAPNSTVAADVVQVGERSQCAQIFFGTEVDGAPGCGPGRPYTSPLIADPGAACEFPAAFRDECAGAPAIDVAPREERTLD